MQFIDVASKQWASRPDDQRFLSLPDLHSFVCNQRKFSQAKDVALDHVTVGADESGEMVLLDGQRGEGGPIGKLTNYAFNQLCQRTGASAGYLRTLPAEVAQIPLAYSMLQAGHEDRDAKILVRGANEDRPDAAAITSPSYGRIWNSEVTQLLTDRLDQNWKIPGASYASRDPKRASTLYASDRDIFIFLVDESRPIEVGNEKLFRGFYTWNSEVGSEVFGIATFLYRYVCDNRNIWGPQEFREVRIKHTSGAPHRFVHDAMPRIRNYVQASDAPYRTMITAAQETEVGKDRKSVTDWLKARKFTQSQANGAYDSAERDGLNPRSIWGIVQGLTDEAHAIKHTDVRVDIERRAGSLLSLAS